MGIYSLRPVGCGLDLSNPEDVIRKKTDERGIVAASSGFYALAITFKSAKAIAFASP